MRRSVVRCLMLAVLVAASVSACSSSKKSSATSPTQSSTGAPATSGQSTPATSTAIKLGMITAVSGPLAGERAHDVATVKALVDATNASGGVDGHPISLIVEDDQSSPAGALTAAKVLQADGVVGINFDDAVVEGGPAQYMHQEGIPVTGLGDSPSWLDDNNMFGVFGYSGPGVPSTTTVGVIEKHLAVTKMVGVSYGLIASSAETAAGTLKGAQSEGIKTAGNISISLGGQNFTTTALQIKSLGVQGLYTATSANDNVSLATALVQAGLHLPGIVFATGYDQPTLQASSVSSLNGTYWTVQSAPVDIGSPAVKAYQAVLQKYAPGVFPGSQETFAYAGTYLLISGLQADGASTSRSQLIQAIDHITDFTVGGISATPVDYSMPKATQYGKCIYLVEIKNDQFVSVQKQPFCGQAVSS
jgi:branched-chain amino acid transport system substrate-binding protein